MSTGIHRTSLTPFAASMRDPDPANARRAARDTYQATEGKVVLINKDWLRNWADQKQLDLLAEAAGIKDRGR